MDCLPTERVLRTHNSGYSLLELLMTVSLGALILGLGVPSFNSLLADKRLRVETDALFHAVHRARQESIVRRRVVTLCASVDGQFCDPGNRWSVGWIAYSRRSGRGDQSRAHGDTLISRHRVREGSEVQSNRRFFSFRSTHRRATNGTLVVCDRGGRAASRALVVSYTGRPRVARQDTGGRPYRCAH